MTRAIAYYRTSSAANVGGDSPHRQDASVMRYAESAGLDVLACFWDAAVSGADPIETREGFMALLEFAQAENVTTVLVEDASRFARSMIAQELGVMLLAKLSIRLVTASGQDLSDEDDPSKVMMRQIAGAFSQYEKAKVVEKLRHGRDRVRAETGKCEGRKSHHETNPDLIRQAKRLARKNPKTGKVRSLREISAELAALGFVGHSGKALVPSVVKTLIA